MYISEIHVDCSVNRNMQRNITLLIFLLCPFLSTSFNKSSQEAIAVKIELVGTIDSSGIKVKIDVHNRSRKKLTVLQNRTWSYKWEEFRSFGNYIVQIDRLVGDTFQLFPPSADVDFFSTPGEYISVEPSSTIRDTLHILGHTFSRTNIRKRGFPAGSYRIKVSFNANERSNSQSNSSNWVKFKIE